MKINKRNKLTNLQKLSNALLRIIINRIYLLSISSATLIDGLIGVITLGVVRPRFTLSVAIKFNRWKYSKKYDNKEISLKT